MSVCKLRHQPFLITQAFSRSQHFHLCVIFLQRCVIQLFLLPWEQRIAGIVCVMTRCSFVTPRGDKIIPKRHLCPSPGPYADYLRHSRLITPSHFQLKEEKGYRKRGKPLSFPRSGNVYCLCLFNGNSTHQNIGSKTNSYQ